MGDVVLFAIRSQLYQPAFDIGPTELAVPPFR